MVTVQKKHDLKRQSSSVVYVKSINKLFVKRNGEWIEKRYLSCAEASRETGKPYGVLRRYVKRNQIKVLTPMHVINFLSELEEEKAKKCRCGNPSGMGNVYFEGDEDLIYMCADCGKPAEAPDEELAKMLNKSS